MANTPGAPPTNTPIHPETTAHKHKLIEQNKIEAIAVLNRILNTLPSHVTRITQYKNSKEL